MKHSKNFSQRYPIAFHIIAKIFNRRLCKKKMKYRIWNRMIHENIRLYISCLICCLYIAICFHDSKEQLPKASIYAIIESTGPSKSFRTASYFHWWEDWGRLAKSPSPVPMWLFGITPTIKFPPRLGYRKSGHRRKALSDIRQKDVPQICGKLGRGN